jgi:hypothetical protein
LVRRCLSGKNFLHRSPVGGGARCGDLCHSNFDDNGFSSLRWSYLGRDICTGNSLLCYHPLADKFCRALLDLAGLFLQGMVLLLGATHVSLRKRTEDEDLEPPGIFAGEDGKASWRGVGFRNLAMEMEALQEKRLAPSMSKIRKWEAGKRAKARSSPNHHRSLALDHLLRLGGKLVLRR